MGGVSRLIDQMERSFGCRVTATFQDDGPAAENIVYGLIAWFRKAVRRLARLFSKETSLDNFLPRHNVTNTVATPAPGNVGLPSSRDLLLLACMHQKDGGQSLYQDDIGAIANDRQLFRFIRKQISSTATKRRSFLSLKTVTGIHFTKVSQQSRHIVSNK